MELQFGSSNYDVFINFRGEDTRNTFVGHLHKALKHHGIHAFIDSEDLWKGEDIGAALRVAIKNSKLSIAVLSETYTESSWCLKELTQILECHRTDGQIIFPIFFKVNTSNVKNQTGCFEISPQRHRKEAPETLQRWKQTLQAIGDKSGWVFNTGDDESKLVEDVIQKTWIRMNIVPLIDIKNPVGVESRVDSVLSILSNTSNVGSRDVQFIGICGQGGMGKTTIATVVYNCISKIFSKSCFIGNVREKASQTNGIVHLQEELLYGISRTETKICSSQEGSRLIKARFQNVKTLLILDDVGDRTQLDALARDLSWFGFGSRIIVTTRDQGVLGGVPKSCRKIFEPRELNVQESLRLFSLNAFSTDEPPNDYKDLSVNIVCTAGGLPLALEVIGCDLSMVEDKEVWESKLQMLKQLPDDTVYEKLKTTFDNLHDIEKSMFLDAACFFTRSGVETIIPIWEACGFEPKCHLEVLKKKSLLRIQKSEYYLGDEIWMHDQIRDMGRRIAYNHRPENPNYHSHLWSYDNVMKGFKGNEIVEGIIPSFWDFEEACLCIKDFENMHELRLLNVNGAILKGNFQCLPSRLRWLSWHRCPSEKLPADFYHEELVVLELTEGRFRQAWNKWPQNKLFQQLKILKLNLCRVLFESPNFSGFPRLEKLDLSYCSKLVDLHESLGELKHLVFLDLTSCYNLRKLPNSICKLSSLNKFDLTRCYFLKELLDNIGRLSSLQKLNLDDCFSLKELPSSISGLKESLTELSLTRTDIEALPDDIVLFKKLEVLKLYHNRQLLYLPKSMVTMTSLRDLDLSECKKLLCIPKLPCNLIRLCFGKTIFESIPYIQNLKNLKFIDLGYYHVMVEKFRGFVEMSRIGDEFDELISKLGRSCCVITIPNRSRLTQVHQIDDD